VDLPGTGIGQFRDMSPEEPYWRKRGGSWGYTVLAGYGRHMLFPNKTILTGIWCEEYVFCIVMYPLKSMF
jgi:hypothetical protein